jgi:transposase-like protein
MAAQSRTFSSEFRIGVARRISNGESVSAISWEFVIKRSVLYRWRDAFLKDGEGGLKRTPGRPSGRASPPPLPPSASALERAQQRIGELERKVGQQELENDFLRRAFKRVEELRRKKADSGATASTPKSKA